MLRTLTRFAALTFAAVVPILPATASAAGLPVRVQTRSLAGSCVAQLTSFSFGTFTPVTQAGRFAQGFVSFRCPARVAEIDLSSGTVGEHGFRRMTSRSNPLVSIAYNIYLDAARTTIFGDGTAGSSPYVPAGGASEGSFPIYGEIAAGQTGFVASDYVDTLSITIRLVD